MQTIDHGAWTSYKPNPLPEDAPANAMFARRDSDGMDWYAYVRGNPFGASNVIIAAFWVDGRQNSYVTGPATRDPTAVFPQNCIVHEITDYTGSDPQTDLGDKRFDPATGTFSDLIPPPPSVDILARLEALEAKQREV